MTVTASAKYGFPMATVDTDPAPVRSDWVGTIFTNLENKSLALTAGAVSGRPATPPTPMAWIDPATGRLSVHPGFGGVWLEVPLTADVLAAQAAVSAPPSAVPLSTWKANQFPLGFTVYNLLGINVAADGGWPVTSGGATVWTVRPAGAAAAQWFAPQNTTWPTLWYRSINNAPGTWSSAWQQLAGDALTGMSTSAAQPVNDSTYTQLATWGTDYTSGDITVVSNGFQVARDGLYTLTGMCVVSGGSSAAGAVVIGVGATGGASDALYRASSPFPGAGAVTAAGTWERPMNAGDTVGLYVWQNSTQTRSATARRFTIRRVSNKY